MHGDHRHFRVEATADVVAWSTKPVPFSPTDWRRDLRLGLVEGIRALGSTVGVLAAEVWDGTGRVLDVENALMYNIGPGEFRPFMRTGMWLRRHTGGFLPRRELAGGPVAAHYRYEVVDAVTTPDPAGDRLEFTFKACRPTDVKDTWLAARCAVTELGRDIDLSHGRLGMRVVAPPGLGAGAVKPLLDGIVSALHRASEKDSLTVPILTGWGLPDAERLVTQGAAPLGSRPLIVMQGHDRPAWNPADDLFDEIVVTAAQPDDRCDVSVYRLS